MQRLEETWRQLAQDLDELERSNLRRRPVCLQSAAGPRVVIDGRQVVCLCSNDYLGLACDPAVRQAAADAIGRCGVGAAASRLVCGTSEPHRSLERKLASFKHAQDCVVTSTGWMANHVAMAALVGPGDLVLCDKLNHASIIDAAGSCGARLRTFGHLDYERLTKLLQRHRAEHRRCLIVTDTVFSMDGDLADLTRLVEIKQAFECLLMIDEAHATGVLGAGGRGLAELAGVESAVDATVGTLSKAMGAMGGFVAGREELIETIRNSGRGYIYTTALPPALCEAAQASLDIVESQPSRRERLLAMAAQLRSELAGLGLCCGQSHSQILPVVVGEADAAMSLSRRLLERGFLVPAIRPPTVPRGSSRLRISLSSAHDSQDIASFVQAIAQAAS